MSQPSNGQKCTRAPRRRRINLKAAKALGLTVPDTLLVAADAAAWPLAARAAACDAGNRVPRRRGKRTRARGGAGRAPVRVLGVRTWQRRATRWVSSATLKNNQVRFSGLQLADGAGPGCAGPSRSETVGKLAGI